MLVFSQEKTDSLKSIDLQEVQIISTRAKEKTPLTYSNLDKEKIEKVNYGQDIPYLLMLTPSVVATSDAGTGIGYTGFRIRGTDANRINITANGVPMNDSESHGVFWVNIPDFASSIQDLQVQRGVGTSTNGAGAFGASINLKTAYIPTIPYGEFNGTYGSFNTSKATLKVGTGEIANHWSFDARLSGINSDGFIDRAFVDLKSYFAQAGYYNKNTLLKFITFGGKEKTYHAWDGVPSGNGEEIDYLSVNRTYNPSGFIGFDALGKPLYYNNQTDNYNQTNYQLSFLQILSSALKLNATLHYTKGDGYYEEYKTERKLVEYGLKPFTFDGKGVTKSDLVRQKHLDNHFGGMIFSLDYIQNKWDISLGGGGNYYDGDHFGKVIWTKNYAGDSDFYPEHEYYRSEAGKTDINVFLKANYQLDDHWNFFADMQYRYIKYKINGQNDEYDEDTKAMQLLDFDNTFNFSNPKAGIFYRINSGNDLYASLAIGHREPNRNNYTEGKLAALPKTETLYDYELGYKYHSPSFSAGVNLYYMKYKDQLILTGEVNDIGEMLTSNIPDSYRAGIEVTAGIPIASWLQWNGNLTLSKSKIKEYTEYIDDWETGKQAVNYLGTTSIAYSPDVVAGNLFSVNFRNYSAGLQSLYVGKQYIDNSESNERKLDPYFVNNLRLSYTLKLNGIKSLTLNALINNLFNEKYESNGYVWYTWYEGAGNERTRKNQLRYFPQAETNVIVNAVIRF
ncbi:TonB-dependent receptor [Bacteroidia bacterium]|nr:TonB-dependent receptor [Bacteroidia bacterium]